MLLVCVVLELALEDHFRSIFNDFWRVCSVLMIGCVLSCLIGRKPGCRPDPNPPVALAGAVVVGFMARGAIDLLRLFLT